MTDLLFKRYASPFLFLDSLIGGRLVDGLLYLVKSDNEEKLWQLYLHSFPSESFDKWKEKVVIKKQTMTKGDVAQQVKKAQDILNNFTIGGE